VLSAECATNIPSHKVCNPATAKDAKSLKGPALSTSALKESLSNAKAKIKIMVHTATPPDWCSGATDPLEEMRRRSVVIGLVIGSDDCEVRLNEVVQESNDCMSLLRKLSTSGANATPGLFLVLLSSVDVVLP